MNNLEFSHFKGDDMMCKLTDCLMVIITTVYAGVTIFIMLANRKSAKVAQEELREMKRQYEEDNRPFIEAEFCFERRKWFIFRLVNHGKRNAQHVKFEFDEEFINSLPEKEFRQLLEKQNNKECIIGVGQHHDIYIATNKLINSTNKKPITGWVKYQDEKKEYEVPIFIDIENYATFMSVDVEEPLIKEVKNISKEIEQLKCAVEELEKNE